jgi:hypothetical protein
MAVIGIRPVTKAAKKFHDLIAKLDRMAVEILSGWLGQSPE